MSAHPHHHSSHRPRLQNKRDARLRTAKHITAWTAAGGFVMTGGLAVLAEHSFSGVSKAAAVQSPDTISVPPAPATAVAPVTVAPVIAPPVTGPPVTVPVGTVAAIPVATVPPTTAAPVVEQTTVAPPTVAPTTAATRHHHHTTPVVTGGS